MATDFSRTLCLLRQEKKLSQRKAATELGISQALLSHYENGAREPGLDFVCRACRYFGVSADYLLGLADADEAQLRGEELAAIAAELETLSRRMHTALEGQKK